MASQALQGMLAKLDKVKAVASGNYEARCPAHEDQKPSLSIRERHDGSVLLHCHAGCATESILAVLNLTFADLYVPAQSSSLTRQIVASYDYQALDGTLLYQAVRYSPKEFRQRRPDGKGGWIWNMQDMKGKRVPYRLPSLVGAPWIFVVEGEKDAERLMELGIAPATTNIGGAGKWSPIESKALRDAGVQRVIVIPDNDEAGSVHALEVVASVQSVGLAADLLTLPMTLPHGDVSDWLNQGYGKEELETLVTQVLYGLGPEEAIAVPIFVEPQEEDDLPPLADYHLTDLGAAESFRDRLSAQLCFDHQRQQWLIWDGHYWRPDRNEASYRLAQAHVRWLEEKSQDIPEYSVRTAVHDWAIAREKRSVMKAMLQHASTLEPMAVDGSQWDANGWILGCSNGVVDLRTGLLRPGSRDDFVSQQVGPVYDADATAPRWLQFLLEVFEGNVELVHFVQKAVGYSLTADMREQCFFVAYGSGSNGKSLFLDLVELIAGTYGYRADMRMFAGSHSGESDGFKNADFRGKRMIAASEVKPGSQMNEHVLKHMTGGESLRAEYKFGRSFTIRPVGKIWLGVNHRPHVVDDSYGFWRRLRLIPFLQTFAGSSDDRSLKQALQKEASGILAWAVRGCLAWQAEGLDPPEIVRAATERYQQGEDVLADFVESRLDVVPDMRTSLLRVYEAYRDWAVTQGIPERSKLSAKQLDDLMQTRPIVRVKEGGNVYYQDLAVVRSRLFDGDAS